MSSNRFVKFIVAGQIRKEFIIDATGKPRNDQIGGSILYAATALNRWGGQTGLLGMVGKNFPFNEIEQLEEMELDIRGVKIAPEDVELNTFYAYSNQTTCIRENPVAVYAANHLTYPKQLLEYSFDHDEPMNGSFPFYSRFLLEDIPADYLDASGAHICPLNLTCQIQLSTVLQRGAIHTLTLQPHSSVMVPERISDFAILAKDMTAMLMHETEIRNLFQYISNDILEMMEMVSSYGCRIVIIKNNINGYLLYDHISSQKFHIPEYPVQKIDPTGEMDVFCGAFLAGYQTSFDPLYAGTLASVAASIKAEGNGPFSINTSLPGLDKVRMAALRDRVIRL